MWFMILFFGCIIAYLIWAANYNIKKSEEKHQKENDINEKGNEYNAVYSTEINHICGLPLSENSRCILHLCDNQIVVEGTGQIFKLKKDKIIDMNIKTSKEVRNSISGAVGGAILLGPIGAFLGGSSTDFHRFFIIIYENKDNEEQCISFDLKDDLKIYKEIYNYIEQFKNNITEKKEIEL
jgi:hypothetical protein